jgi:putative tryptophan/tyrosine transport system substrate-binding protein
MKRREFITILGGAVLAWPFATRAQQSDRVRRIGVLTSDAEDDPGVWHVFRLAQRPVLA